MEWLRIVQYFRDAMSMERDKAEFQAKIAGAKITRR
jgi:hypothetical protein